MGEIVLLVNDVVIEFQLDVKSQSGLDTLESFLEGTEGVVLFDVPLHNFPISGFPKQSFALLSRLLLGAIGEELRETELGYPLLEHSTLRSPCFQYKD